MRGTMITSDWMLLTLYTTSTEGRSTGVCVCVCVWTRDNRVLVDAGVVVFSLGW